MRIVASTMARSHRLHPNVSYLMRQVLSRFDVQQVDQPDNSRHLIRQLTELGEDERRFALKLLFVAMVIDGRLNIWEKRLLDEAHRVCGLSYDKSTVRNSIRQFQSGNGLELEAFAASQQLIEQGPPQQDQSLAIEP